MGKSTDYPLCDICNTHHPRGGRHAWDKDDAPQTPPSPNPARGLQDVQAVEGQRRKDREPERRAVQRPQAAPRPAELIEEGLREALAVVKGESQPHAVHVTKRSPRSVSKADYANRLPVALRTDEPAFKRGKGRPATIDDMKAYKARKAKEYRAAKKAKS